MREKRGYERLDGVPHPLQGPSAPGFFFFWTFSLVLLLPSLAHAYIGPGAGFALVGSFFVVFITFLSALFYLVTWPIRWIFLTLLRMKAMAHSRVKRVVILGLDGQDPDLTEQFLAEGILPNFAKLRDQGAFARLGTSLLSESPVAWSSFQTGCNPGRHRIYDFLVPNRKSHLPELSSAQVTTTSQRTLKLGKYRIPLGSVSVNLGRKSVPFWKILGDHGIFSTVIRVPITFPPEKHRGVLLSAMCVPDLKGSQGTYFYYCSDPADQRKLYSGIQLPLTLEDGAARGAFSGPENTLVEGGGEMTIDFEVRVGEDGTGTLVIGKSTWPLRVNEYTPWIPLDFKPGLMKKVRGICMVYPLELKRERVRLYVTPIHIDPERPALPISHPMSYAMYLAKTQGTFATLGVAEDTSALNEGVVDEDAFLKQAYIIHREREKQYFDALDKTRNGLVCCVFDLTDRVQHMFFRCIDDQHPANAGRETAKYKDVIRQLYKDMDDLLGRTLERLDDKTALFVMSDHGFKSFRRGVNLNTWLHQNGLLALKNGNPTGADMLQDIDWSRTKAYAVGFGGIYLNMAGREAKGIVGRGEEAEAVRAEIKQKLVALHDPKEGREAVKTVYDAREVFSGPYVGEAPDLIAGFNLGYRVSWSSVTGGVAEEIFEDNTRAWSGDHNFNPPDVPGMLFTNRPLATETPSIMDIGPTVLDLFGVAVPNYCDGKTLMPAGAPSGKKREEAR